MNQDNTTAPSGPERVTPACARIAHNRKLLANWLEQDRLALSQPSLAGWATQVVLPLLDGLRQHPTASIALGALVRAWLRPVPADRSRTCQSNGLEAAVGLVRHQPKTILAVTAIAGAGWWWSRAQSRSSTDTSPTSSN